MSSCRELVLALSLALAGGAVAAQGTAYPGVGRPATSKEVAAWDIDVRADFKGLPRGSGSVSLGQDVWEGKCASCHGIFGESNEVFSPLVGGTTQDDVASGRVAKLLDNSFPGRTTLMKVSQVSTLWDYINRAMPWNAPKSLKPDEVYGVVAFLLNLGGVVPDNFVLSDRNMAEAQARLPNRQGMTLAHAMWPGKPLDGKARKPDVNAKACMSGCEVEVKVASLLPDHARNAHGNLAQQNRLVGAQRGADTTRPAGAVMTAATTTAATTTAAGTSATPAATVGADGADGAAAWALAGKASCTACHGLDSKLVGPAFRDIAKKYAGRSDAEAYLSQKIKAGGSGVWGSVPMPPQTLSDADARALAQWLSSGARK